MQLKRCRWATSTRQPYLMLTYRAAVGTYFKDTAELQYCMDNITVVLLPISVFHNYLGVIAQTYYIPLDLSFSERKYIIIIMLTNI